MLPSYCFSSAQSYKILSSSVEEASDCCLMGGDGGVLIKYNSTDWVSDVV